MKEVTLLLASAKAGDAGAADRLWREVYAELHRIASGKMIGEQRQITLQATVLVHEAWLRLSGPDGEVQTWDSRAHFFSAAAEAMRRVLVDQARRRLAGKRGGGEAAAPLEDLPVAAPASDEKLLEVHEVIDELAKVSPRQATIVKLRFFVGLGHEEIAAALDIGESSVRREWTFAKAWLYQAIKAAGASGMRPGEKDEKT